MNLASERQFGEALPGVNYVERPGVYALVVRDGLLLVAATPAGLFLPGGGIDDGEGPVEALRRELREEAGTELMDAVEVGIARQYVIDSQTGIGYNKVERFFLVTVGTDVSENAEADHTARWVSIDVAVAGMREPAQAWAVRTLLTPR